MSRRLKKNFVSGLAAAFGTGFLPPALLCAAQPPAPHPAIEAGVGHNETWWSEDVFRLIDRTADLPASVKKAFPPSLMQRGFRMADPGQPWSTGCSPIGPLPARRLIFAGLSKDHCFVYFTGGGRGVYNAVNVFRLSGNTARFVGSLHTDFMAGRYTGAYPDWKTLQGVVRGKALEPRK